VSRFGVDHTAPLTLSHGKALERACELKGEGLPWTSICVVMRDYHGWDRSVSWWTKALRGQTYSPMRGIPFPQQQQRVAA
jgi:hypothetical protein